MTDRMKKINMVVEESNKNKELNAKRRARIDELKKEIDTLKEQSGIATANGNLDAFKDLIHNIQDKEIEIEFLTKQLEIEKNTFVEVARVRGAWEDYESKRRVLLKKANDKRASAINSLYEAMKEIMELQNEGLDTRNKCAKLIGMPTYNGELNRDNLIKLESLFEMEYAKNITKSIGHTGNPAEIKMLMALDKIPSNADTYRLFDVLTPINLAFLK